MRSPPRWPARSVRTWPRRPTSRATWPRDPAVVAILAGKPGAKPPPPPDTIVSAADRLARYRAPGPAHRCPPRGPPRLRAGRRPARPGSAGTRSPSRPPAPRRSCRWSSTRRAITAIAVLAPILTGPGKGGAVMVSVSLEALVHTATVAQALRAPRSTCSTRRAAASSGPIRSRPTGTNGARPAARPGRRPSRRPRTGRSTGCRRASRPGPSSSVCAVPTTGGSERAAAPHARASPRSSAAPA